MPAHIEGRLRRLEAKANPSGGYAVVIRQPGDDRSIDELMTEQGVTDRPGLLVVCIQKFSEAA